MKMFYAALLIAALVACTLPDYPPVTADTLVAASNTYVCPEIDPAQPNCKVP